MATETLCAYCGRHPATEQEHVVARAFFDKPLPDNLPKIPTCSLCNRGKWLNSDRAMSEDEEYMRTLVTADTRCTDHASARNVLLGPVSRSMKRGGGFAKLIQQSINIRNVRTPGGIILPNQITMHIFWSRYERVLTKIVRGLYYHVQGQRLPDEYGVMVHPWIGPDATAQAWGFMQQSRHIGPVDYQNGAFTFVCCLPDENECLTAWLMQFYNGYCTMALTVPTDFDAREHGQDPAQMPLSPYLPPGMAEASNTSGA